VLSEDRCEEWMLEEDDDDRIQSVQRGGYIRKNGSGGSLEVTTATTASFLKEEDVFTLEPTGVDESGNYYYILVCHKEMIARRVGKNELYTLPYDETAEEYPEEARWKLELSSGELVFISNAVFDKRLRCNCSGNKVSLTKEWYGWDVWRFMDVGDGTVLIASWTHAQKMLCSKNDGTVYTTQDRQLADKWHIEKSKDALLIRSTTHNRILSMDDAANNNIRTIDPSEIVVDGCFWMVEPAHGNVFFISSLARDKRIGCDRKSSLFLTSNRKNWEEWNMEFKKGGSSVTVTSRVHGETRFLAAAKDGKVLTSEHPFVWDVEESCHGGFHLISTDKLYYLTCDEKHNLSTTTSLDGGTSESWLFEPRMPQTMTESQRNTMTIAAVSGLTIMTFAPVVVMGVMGAVGLFGAGSISAGSMAGTVVTLKSIGAAGLGTTGVLVMSSSSGPNKNSLTRIGSSDDVASRLNHRPYANWRNW
jgi:hypothetical protein